MCGETDNRGDGGVGAVGCDAEQVFGVPTQLIEGEGVVSGSGGGKDAVPRIRVRGAVVEVPRCLIVAGNPAYHHVAIIVLFHVHRWRDAVAVGCQGVEGESVFVAVVDAAARFDGN